MTTKFLLHPEVIDPTPGRKSNNLIEPDTDSLSEDETVSEFETNQVLDVEIVSKDGRWNSVATVNNVYEDEYGILLGVEVDWGSAVLA